MGLFEWIGENFNPGPVGKVTQDEETAWQPKNKFIVWLLTLLGVGLFAFFVWSILLWDNKQWQGFLILAVYLVLSWFLSPQPDHRNMGWFGGIINNPFQISDNFNRALLCLPLFCYRAKSFCMRP